MDGIVEPSTHKVRPFECSTCLKRFTRQENLKRHARSVHQNANAKTIKCTYCTVTLSREDLRTRHVRKCHPSAPSLEFALPDIPTDVLSNININHAIPERAFDFPTHQPTLWRPEYITSYFENFHPRMPFLHEPSFDIISEPETLLLTVSCLGSMYHPEGSSIISKEIFDSSYNSLQFYIQEDDSRYRENWVLQSFILLETFAIYSCDDNLFLIAQKIHRDLVDASRRYHLLQDSISVDDSEDEEQQKDNEMGIEQDGEDQQEDLIEKKWREFIRHESQKRIIYSLYYLDTQLSITTNTKPLLSALEIKYSLPSRDDLFTSPTPQTWNLLNHEDYFSFNDQDDENGNPQPRPAHGLLYESMMHLIHPGPKGRSLKLLWYSPFAALVLVVQIQMMARELTCASVFLYSNLRENDNRHNLTMIAEEHRGPISQALNNLADLIPRRKTTTTTTTRTGELFPDSLNHEIGHGHGHNNSTLWHSVWISWYYTCIALTHQDALLSTGIVECNLPAAISTAWELGKPRAKIHRDVYEDRDVFRIVNNLEQIIYMLNSFPSCTNGNENESHHHIATATATAPATKKTTNTNNNNKKCLEDPFVTILGFKACMMGWRVVRLMILNIDKETNKKPSPSFGIGTTPTRAVLLSLMNAVNSSSSQGIVAEPGLDFNFNSMHDLDTTTTMLGNDCEITYLKWAQRVFTARNTWPIGGWMTAVLQESLDEATEDYDKLSQMQV